MSTARTTRPIRRGRARVAAAAVALLGVAAPPALAADAAPPARAAAAAPAVQRALDGLVRDGYPGAMASVTSRDSRVRDFTAGVGDRRTRARVPVDGYVRIASNTKTYTAVVVLQLAAEGRVDLDAPVARYVPDALRGARAGARRVTVRDLLRHTSGLPDYTDVLFARGSTAALLNTYQQPLALLDRAFAGGRKVRRPGGRHAYSNTNYVLAGLLVEAVTGRPVDEAITSRVLRRAGLRETYFPRAGDRSIRSPHPRGYDPLDRPGTLTDVTRLDPSLGWAAGQMIATPSDLNRAFGALVAGRLLPPAQLAAMRTTVAAGEVVRGQRYGLGLVRTPLSCGGEHWGHGGTIHGFQSLNGVTDDGRAATIVATRMPRTLPEIKTLYRALDTALCTA